jgi:hypothetical protein
MTTKMTFGILKSMIFTSHNIIKKQKKSQTHLFLYFLLHFITMDIFNKYESFLLKNASQISSIEASLRTLTYILPGEFHLLSLSLLIINSSIM